VTERHTDHARRIAHRIPSPPRVARELPDVQDRGDGTADLHPALPGPTVVGPQKRECILLWHLE